MSDELKRWMKERFKEDCKRIDAVSWGNEKGWHDHEIVKLLPDGDIDYYKMTHRDRQKQK